MQARNEVTVGALTLIGIVALVLGYNYLKGVEFFSRDLEVAAGFENTSNVFVSNAVVIRGIPVGKVSEISVGDTDEFPVVMKFKIDRNIKIQKDSRFVIKTIDLFGTKQVEIIRGTSDEYFSPGDAFIAKGEIEADMIASISDQLLPVKDQITGLVDGLDSLVGSVNALLTNEKSSIESSIRDLSATMKNLESITARVDLMLENQGDVLESVVQDASKLTSTIANNTDEIDRIIKNFGKLSDNVAAIDIEEMVSTIKKNLETIDGLIQGIDRGEGNIGKIVKDEQLYNDINATIISLDDLLKDLKANPKKYINISVFGGKSKD